MYIVLLLGILIGVVITEIYHRKEKKAWKFAITKLTTAKALLEAEVLAVKTFATSHIAELEAYVASFETMIAEDKVKTKIELKTIIDRAKKIF